MVVYTMYPINTFNIETFIPHTLHVLKMAVAELNSVDPDQGTLLAIIKQLSA